MIGKAYLTFTVVLLFVATSAEAAPPKAKVSLHPGVTALAPGANFEVGIQFEVSDGWHIYWKNAGDSGMPPRVDWQLPPGFQVGELRFPAPRPHDDPGGLQTNILEGGPVLIQTLTAPPDLKAGEKVKLAADLTWLVCQKLCLMEKGSVSVELPVVSSPGDARPADEALFKRAHAALPVAADKAKYVKVAVSSSAKSVSPGQAFEIMLDATVQDGHHVQSNQPSQPASIGTHVFVESPPGLAFDKVKYPPAEERSHPQLGKVSEYRGKLQFRIPAQVLEDATGTSLRAAGLLTAQACNDKSGVCFPPESVEWSIDLPLTGASADAGDQNPPRRRSAVAGQVGGQPESNAENPAAAPVERGGLQGFLARFGITGLLVGCFLYGLFINATPCVLPLLSIKVLGFVQQAHESRGRTAVLGLAFGVGVMIFFVVLGFLAASGKNVLQFPAVVIGLGTVVMALALSMLGVYTLQAPSAASTLEAHIQQEGILASFGKGALAPVLGFACTGPLLAGMFGLATQQQPHIALIAFLLTGLGMASPYILLGANPKWLSFLPKPGQWMITFERIMGFLLLGMVLWLLHPLTAQIGVEGLEWTLGFLVVVAMACWLLGKVNFNMTTVQRWRYRGGALAMIAFAAFVIYGWVYPLKDAEAEPPLAGGPASTDWSKGVPWERWSPDAVSQAARSGKTVFVDFTAAYCTQCKVNKKVAINTPEVRAKMQSLGVVPFQADFTNGDPQIFEVLKSFSRAGVPMNLIYPAGKPDAPILLEPALSKEYVLRKLDEAGPSRNASDLASAESDT